MIIGKQSGIRKLERILGTIDLHSQIRLKAFKKYILKNKLNFKDKNIIEIGCGDGLNCFELYYNSEPQNILGFDLDQNNINSASQRAKILNISNYLNFHCSNALDYDYSDIGKVDYVLLLDFLEHIPDPVLFLEKIQAIIKEETIIIVSVPTHNYKIVFGEKFHKKVGHIRDGFNINEIRDLFKSIGFKIEEFSYSTGLISSIGCFLFYRIFYYGKFKIFLYPFHFIDYLNDEKISSSIFVILKSKYK